MNRVINIGNKKQACKDLEQFKNKHYDAVDLRINNIHLIKINDYVGYKLFYKNSLFVRSSTLWEIMQPFGSGGKHHYHGLEPEEIIDALSSLLDPVLIYKSYSNRYGLIVSGNEKRPILMIVIELNAGLENERDANINKLVTIYPKENFEKFKKHLNENNIIFNKK